MAPTEERTIEPAYECCRCHATINDPHWALSRQVEKTIPTGPKFIETFVTDAYQLFQWCDDCGVEAGLAQLRQLGFVPIVVEPDPPTPLCAKCHGVFIDETENHVVWTLDEIIDKSGNVVECLSNEYRAPLCAGCAAQDKVKTC